LVAPGRPAAGGEPAGDGGGKCGGHAFRYSGVRGGAA
jgi:hypothetical protein